MIENIQGICSVLGENGCYLFGLIRTSDKINKVYKVAPEVIDALEVFVEQSGIGGSVRASDSFVLKPEALLLALTGREYEVIKAGPTHPLPLDYKLQPGEYEILRFGRTDEKGIEHPHFVSGDGQQHVEWDSWKNSLTVRLGVLVSRRIIRPVKTPAKGLII